MAQTLPGPVSTGRPVGWPRIPGEEDWGFWALIHATLVSDISAYGLSKYLLSSTALGPVWKITFFLLKQGLLDLGYKSMSLEGTWIFCWGSNAQGVRFFGAVPDLTKIDYPVKDEAAFSQRKEIRKQVIKQTSKKSHLRLKPKNLYFRTEPT